MIYAKFFRMYRLVDTFDRKFIDMKKRSIPSMERKK